MVKLTTANVNGLRAAERKGMGEWLAAAKPDILCLQEVRADEELAAGIIEKLWPGKTCHIAQQACLIKGRAGVAIVSTLEPTAIRTGLAAGGKHLEGKSDTGRWVEADFTTQADENITVICAYIHSSDTDGPKQEEKYTFLDLMMKRLIELEEGGTKAVVVGDFNIAHTKIDLKNWRTNQDNKGFLPTERAYVDRWFTAKGAPVVATDEKIVPVVAREAKGAGIGWVDVARQLSGPDVQGPYTWWSWRGQAFTNDAGWRIDYHIATPPLADRAKKTYVDKPTDYDHRWTDHAPLTVEYDI